MTKNNEEFAREKELAREYEKKMAAREQAIKDKMNQHLSTVKKGLYEIYQFSISFNRLFVPAFTAAKFTKPSEFIRKKMPWIFDCIVYERFHEAFSHAVDCVRDYPYSIGWYRRSFRSDNYGLYARRISRIVEHFQDAHCLDADICDVLTGNLPEDAYCYLKTRNTRTAGFAPELLAYELDRNNPRLEKIVTDIVNGDSEFSSVSRELIQGIIMSHNPGMHVLVCRLLVAARLQEGLRQIVCEEADCGTAEAFYAILSTILEHDLLRYSSVKRAVGTWIGLMNADTRDLDRISNKNLDMVCKCLKDIPFREACLASEDSMGIHIALWSYAFENLGNGLQILDRLVQNGTHHQVLTAGYFVANLEDETSRHIAARDVLKSRWEHEDILAVYLPCFIPAQNLMASNLSSDQGRPEYSQYFESTRQAKEFCDRLMTVHRSMKKKEKVFSPCIFPWFAASVKKSDLVEKAMVIAAMAEDQERIDRLCENITDCEAFGRDIYFRLLTSGKKTPAVRKLIIDCLEDKSLDTRRSAYLAANGLRLTGEEYRRIEEMLRLRYDDLRRNVMELLMKQSDEALQATVLRLLTSSKTAMRTAGLDIVTQMAKSDDRKGVADCCMEAVCSIVNPTTQEKILIDALLPKEAKIATEALFDESDRVIPLVVLDDYGRECVAAFMEVFPDSKLEKQIQDGKPVSHGPVKLPNLSCTGAKNARDKLKSLSDFFVAHERETYVSTWGGEKPLGSSVASFGVWVDKKLTIPRMDLWEQWSADNQITAADLYGMLILGCAQTDGCPYLIRCSKYVRDIYGPGFEQKVTYRYAEHMQRIVLELLRTALPENTQQKIAMALGLWIARCLPEDMLIGFSTSAASGNEQVLDFGNIFAFANGMINLPLDSIPQRLPKPAGHFIRHPQISALISRIDHSGRTDLKQRIPVLLNIYERTYASTSACMEQCGNPQKERTTRLLDQIYRHDYRNHVSHAPDVGIWIRAFHYGLISRRTMYCYLMEPGNIINALKLVTAVCVMCPNDGETVSSKTFSMYNRYSITREYQGFIGEETEPDEEQLALIALCKETAGRMVSIVLDSELVRGDSPAEYSAYVTGIHMVSGMATFVRILSALGKDSLDRSVYYYGNSQSKRGNLSYLLARCVPEPGEDAEKLRKLLNGTDITEKRLLEAALYSPAWIDIIGEYLNLPGLKSACYYFMAHMNEQFDEQKKAVIARFSPLTEDELNLGAFDVKWFWSAYEQLGEKKFDLIYDAAKYISDGNKHTRARKYADAALGRLNLAETEAAVKDKRNKDLLMAYAIIPLDGEADLVHRYLYLQQFLKESRQFGSQRSASEKKAVETALRNLATNAGFSDTMRLTLRMETKLVEDNRELFKEKTVGEWTFCLTIDEQGTADILCCKDGKLLKSIPSKAKKDPYVVRLQEMKKQLTDQYRRTRRMFEQAMEDRAEFTVEEMRQLCQNPVVSPIVSKLIFKSGDALGLFEGTNLIDLAGSSLAENGEDKLTVAHPLHLYQSGKWQEFQQYLYENQIIQPFRQVFRELYVKTKEELGSFHSLRYAGNQIQPKKAAACLKERRWVADIEAGLQKIYYQDNIVATIYALADWFTPADIEAPTLEYVAFYDRKTGKQLKIDDIPNVIFSEVMRDVDMAVSVAHAGGVDPETSHSTVEVRSAILSFTLPLLRLKNVKVEGSHAFIDGKLAEYSVHLGSGTVHQIGGAMLNVLPVHSQQRGRIFLPFVDEDPKTAEIISKVILFAEDHKLKDPTILEQIAR